jgi:hypothetical protein
MGPGCVLMAESTAFPGGLDKRCVGGGRPRGIRGFQTEREG